MREGLAQPGDQLAAKDRAQHLDREEEGRPRVDPPRPVRRQAARRDDAVDVRMMLEALPPGVEDHEAADGGTQAFRVRRDLEQRGGGRAKEEVVDDALVDERQPGERLGHGEDEVHVADRQELLLARRDPGVAGRRQALRTMPIAAAVVREGRLRTPVTAIAMAAERRGPTLGDRPEDAPMQPGHPGAMRLQEALAMSAHDVGHLEGWPRHRLCFSRVSRAVSGPARS